MKKLDAIDVAILDALQRERRLPNVALAKSVGLSPTPCAEECHMVAGGVELSHLGACFLVRRN